MFSDQDEATRDPLCFALNGMSLKQLHARLHTAMLDVARVLDHRGLLGKPLDAHNPPPFALPIPGFELEVGTAGAFVGSAAVFADGIPTTPTRRRDGHGHAH